jgi:hypothetical protein
VQQGLGLELRAEAEVAQLQVHALARLVVEGYKYILGLEVYVQQVNHKGTP